MVKQRLTTADVAGEVACLKQRIVGFKCVNLYDINPKARLQRGAWGSSSTRAGLLGHVTCGLPRGPRHSVPTRQTRARQLWRSSNSLKNEALLRGGASAAARPLSHWELFSWRAMWGKCDGSGLWGCLPPSALLPLLAPRELPCYPSWLPRAALARPHSGHPACLRLQTYVLKLARSGEDGEKILLLIESGVRMHTVQVRCRTRCSKLAFLGTFWAPSGLLPQERHSRMLGCSAVGQQGQADPGLANVLR